MAYTKVKDLMAAICDALREKEGSTDLIPHQELPDRILNLSSGGENVSYSLPSFFANLNDDLVKTYKATDTITCEVGHTYLVFTTYVTNASYADSQYISVTGADIVREASFTMTGSYGSDLYENSAIMSSFVVSATQTDVVIQHRFSIDFNPMYQTVITLDVTDNVNEITDREMLSISESNAFQTDAVGKYYLVLLGSVIPYVTSLSTSGEIIYEKYIGGTLVAGHYPTMTLLIIRSTTNPVEVFRNTVSSRNALFYMDISEQVSDKIIGNVKDGLNASLVFGFNPNSWTSYIESSRVMSIEFSNDSIISTWKGGIQVSTLLIANVPIETSYLNTITMKANATACYGENFPILIAINPTPIRDYYAFQQTFARKAESKGTMRDIELAIDVSDLTGKYYIHIAIIGYSCTITDLILE